MIKRITSSSGPAPRFRYSPCVRIGNRGIVSGMVGIDSQTGELSRDGLEGQTKCIFDNLRAALPDYGFEMSDLVLSRVYMSDFKDFAAFNQVWESEFLRIDPPARTTIGVSGLPLDALVEIEFELACQAST